MKKVLAWILALGVLLSFAACSTQTAQPTPTPTATPEAAPAIQTVAFLLPGELGDRGILDSAAAALEQLQAEDRLQLTTISLDTDAAAQDVWGSRVAEIAESAAYLSAGFAGCVAVGGRAAAGAALCFAGWR